MSATCGGDGTTMFHSGYSFPIQDMQILLWRPSIGERFCPGGCVLPHHDGIPAVLIIHGISRWGWTGRRKVAATGDPLLPFILPTHLLACLLCAPLFW